MANLHTHNTHYTHTLSVLFGGVKSFGLRGEGRRDWEGMEQI